MAISHGQHEIVEDCAIDDFDWNHMDQDHRPWIHRTYERASRLFLSPSTQVSVTALRVFGVPVLVQVTDVRVERGLFHQFYTLLGLFQIHAVIRSLPGKTIGERYVVSHPLLRIFHPLILRRLKRLNEVQNAEDKPVRSRRTQLRAAGYRFHPEERDYVTANLKSNQVVYPKIGTQAISLSGLEIGKVSPVKAGVVDFLVRADSAHSFSVWPGVCPHEGGPLQSGRVCPSGKEIQCLWHGRQLSCVALSAEMREGTLAGYTLRLSSDFSSIEVADVD